MLLLILLIIVVLIFVSFYNSLIIKRNAVTNAFGSIDVMLKKRFDLIPNLVATVKQYAQHEQGTFEKITELRTKEYSQMTENDKAQLDNTLRQAQRSFFMVAENYPDLKASINFADLQRSLNETEEQLSAARRSYNAAVTIFNNAIQTFPGNVIANMFNFTAKTVLETAAEEKANPNVGDLFK